MGFSKSATLAAEYADKGAAHFEAGEFEQAIAQFTEAIRAEPNNASFFLQRGDVHYAIEKYDMAIADYSAALRLDLSLADPISKPPKKFYTI